MRSSMLFLALVVTLCGVIPANSDSQQIGKILKDKYGDALPQGTVARLGTTRLLHKEGDLPTWVFHKGAKQLISCGGDLIRYWDTTKGNLLKTIRVEKGKARTLAISRDGKHLATGGPAGALLWDSAKGRLIHSFKCGSVSKVFFSPDGKYLITDAGKGNGAICQFDAKSGKEISRFVRSDGCVVLGLSADGRKLISQIREVWFFDRGGENGIIVHNLTGKELRRFSFSLEASALSPDGKSLVVAGNKRVAKSEKWKDVLEQIDAQTGKPVRSFQGWQGGRISHMTISLDGKLLVVRLLFGGYKFYDMVNGKRLQNHPLAANKLDGPPIFSADGKTAATVGEWARLWDVDSGKPLFPTEGHRSAVQQLLLSLDGKLLASRSTRGPVRIWDANKARELSVLAHGLPVQTMVFLPKKNHLVTVSDAIRAWKIETGRMLHRNPLDPWLHVHDISSFDAGKKLLVSLSVLSMVSIPSVSAWDLDEGRWLWSRGLGQVWWRNPRPALSPDGKTMLIPLSIEAAFSNETISAALHDAHIGKKIRILNLPATYRPERPWLFSPDGRLVALCSFRMREKNSKTTKDNFGVQVFEVASGKALQHWPITGQQRVLAFSADSKKLAVSEDDRAKVYDVVSGKRLYRSAPLNATVTAIAFSRDSSRLFTGMSDTTILFLDLPKIANSVGCVERRAPKGKRLLLGPSETHQ